MHDGHSERTSIALFSMLANLFTKRVVNVFLHETKQESKLGFQSVVEEVDSIQLALLSDGSDSAPSAVIGSGSSAYQSGCGVFNSCLEDSQFSLEIDDANVKEFSDDDKEGQIGTLQSSSSRQPSEDEHPFFIYENVGKQQSYLKHDESEANGKGPLSSEHIPVVLSEVSGEVAHRPILTAAEVVVRLRSALRGGHEKSGLGPRPKLSVTWAPDVYEPRGTSKSHTVSPGQSHHRRHHHHSQKTSSKGSKSARSSSSKKSEKKLFRKTRHVQNDNYRLRLSPTASQRGTRGGSLMLTKVLDVQVDEKALKTVLMTPLALPQKGFLVARPPTWPTHGVPV